MFKSILVPTVGLSKDVGALKLAQRIARKFDGHLSCLHVRKDPAELVMSASGFGAPLGTQMMVTDLIEVLQETDAKRSERARKTYEAFCEQESLWSEGLPHKAHGPSASWQEKTGDEIDILSAEARVHDVTVLGNVADAMGLPPSAAGDILLASGRPIILATEKAPESFHTILVAWKDTAEAARAVGAAMPLLAQADKVVVVQVAENKDVTATSARAIAENLRWHCTDVELMFMPETASNVYETIITTAGVVHADLVVMGGYGHSRVGEFIFGGLTNRMLEKPKIPVFMVH